MLCSYELLQEFGGGRKWSYIGISWSNCSRWPWSEEKQGVDSVGMAGRKGRGCGIRAETDTWRRNLNR